MIKLVDYYCVKGAREEFEKAALHFIDQASSGSERHVKYVLQLMEDASNACGGIETLL